MSPRDHELVKLVSQGLKNHEIAAIQGTTEHMIKNRLRSLYDLLGFNNRVELSLWYIKHLDS